MPDPSSNSFALNHITCRNTDVAGLAALARSVGLSIVEIRNDIPATALADGSPADTVARALREAGVAAASVNALQRFNEWSDVRAAEAEALAQTTAASGAAALVLCPVNEAGRWTDDMERLAALRHALEQLRPILQRYGLIGLVEPLGFEISSLRLKREAIDAIDAVDGAATYRLLHDTFHHAIASDPDIFPERTGLVHISGVSDPAVALPDMRDAHRVLVDAADRLDNVGQIAALRRGGYDGVLSIECFADSVSDDPQLARSITDSIAFLRNGA